MGGYNLRAHCSLEGNRYPRLINDGIVSAGIRIIDNIPIGTVGERRPAIRQLATKVLTNSQSESPSKVINHKLSI